MRGLLSDPSRTICKEVGLREDGNATLRLHLRLLSPGEAGRISFAGIPMGPRVHPLVLTDLKTGGHHRKSTATIEAIKSFAGEFKFETFISLSCHNCPDVVRALNLLGGMIDGVSRGQFHAKSAAVPTRLSEWSRIWPKGG